MTTFTSHVALLNWLTVMTVMIARPKSWAVTTPSSTQTIVSSEEVHNKVFSVAFSGRIVASNVVVSPDLSSMKVTFNSTDSAGTTFRLTVTEQATLFSPEVAVMMAAPSLIAVTLPSFTTATKGSLLDQLTDLSVASSGLTVADNVSESPSVNSSVVLLISIDATGIIFLFTFTLQVAVFPPEVAVMTEFPSDMAITMPDSDTVATD